MYFVIVSSPIAYTGYKIAMEKAKPYILASKGIIMAKKLW